MFDKIKDYFTGPAKVHKILVLFMQLLSLLQVNLLVIAITTNTNTRPEILHNLLHLNDSIVILIGAPYYARLITKDSLNSIFLEIWFCCFSLWSLIGFLKTYGLVNLPPFLESIHDTFSIIVITILFFIIHRTIQKIIKSKKSNWL